MTPYEAASTIARRYAADAVPLAIAVTGPPGDLSEYDWRRVQQLAKRYVTAPDPAELAEAWELLAERAEVTG